MQSKILVPILFLLACNQNALEISINETIDLGHDRLISEGILSVNPNNPKHLMGAFLTAEIQEEGRDYFTEVIISQDGGKNWYTTLSKQLPEAADPWCLLTPNGKAIVADISAGSKFHLTTQFSSDGKHWQDTSSLGLGHDHGMLLQDDSEGPISGVIYLISTQDDAIFIARSKDEGQSFQKINQYRPFDSLDINAKTPVVLSDGTLLIPFITRASRPMKSYLISSKDGGLTFTSPTFITDQNGRRHHVLVVNKAAPYTDFLYYVFVGKDRDGIFLTKSEDLGKSWSSPYRIDLQRSEDTWTDLGMVAVSPEGILGILWTERIDDNCYDKYFIASKDGGNQFLPAIKVNDMISCPDPTNGWIRRAWPQGGDYHGLVGLANGDFLAMWSDARTGKFRLYSTNIKVK